MIDLPQTIAALERVLQTSLVIGDDRLEDTLRALVAALGQAQEAWQYQRDPTVCVPIQSQDDPEILHGWSRVLIVPMEEEK